MSEFDDLNASLGRDPEDWRPEEEGEQISGRVIDFTERETQWGTCPVLTLLTEDGREVVVFASRSVLKSAIYNAGVLVGDLVGIRYQGKKMSKSGSQYHGYRLVARGPDGEPKGRGNGAAALGASNADSPLSDSGLVAQPVQPALTARDDELPPF